MKKLLLVLAVALSASLANAQRVIDWSVDSLAMSDTIRATSSGTPLAFSIVMKNLGPDTVKAGDSVFYNILFVVNNQIITGYPSNSASNFSVIRLSKDYATGDTMQLQLALNGPRVNQSFNVTVAVTSLILNRPAINGEPTTTDDNNVKTKAVVWMSEYGFGVGLKEFADVNLSVYPNPVSDVLNFDIDYNNAARVEIMDIAGRKIEAANFEMNHASVDVRNYNKGIYLYQILSNDGQVVKTGKITVN